MCSGLLEENRAAVGFFFEAVLSLTSLLLPAIARNPEGFSFCHFPAARAAPSVSCHHAVQNFWKINRRDQIKSGNYEEKHSNAGHGILEYSYGSVGPRPYRCYPSSYAPKSIMTSFMQGSKKREAKPISPSLSIVRGLLVLRFPGHIWRDGIGFHWKPGLCAAGAPQIQFHALYAKHLPSAWSDFVGRSDGCERESSAPLSDFCVFYSKERETKKWAEEKKKKIRKLQVFRCGREQTSVL